MNELPDRRAAARADGDEERARGALARIALGGTNGNGSGDEGEINVTLTTSLVRAIYATGGVANTGWCLNCQPRAAGADDG